MAAAKANVTRAEADLGQMKAKLDQAEADWKRAQEVGTKGGLSQTDIDARRAEYLTAKANLEVGNAAIEQAKTGVKQADATLKKAKTNLSYTTIKSPVKGVIISRRVNVGQTVVASLNAPSLFLIAKDLTRIQVWTSVNEADIGNIHPGQPTTFTVDAYPGRTFKGSVNKIRLDATMTQSVVTYTVEVSTDNSDGKLLPYMSASVLFEVKRRDDVLIAPVAALRWFPKNEQVVPEAREEIAAMTSGRTERSGPPATRPAGGLVWLPEGKFVRPLRVHVGMTDAVNTEISGEGVNEGLEVVTGEQRASDADAGEQARNPFMPSFGSRGGGSGRKGG
jgi:HlyD family secretion protein